MAIIFFSSRSKTEWLRVLDAAIHHSRETLPYQAIMSAIRKNEHAEEEARETAERLRRDSQADIIENTQAELMAEKLVCFYNYHNFQRLSRGSLVFTVNVPRYSTWAGELMSSGNTTFTTSY